MSEEPRKERPLKKLTFRSCKEKGIPACQPGAKAQLFENRSTVSDSKEGMAFQRRRMANYANYSREVCRSKGKGLSIY